MNGKVNGLGVAGLVLGIIALVTSCFGVTVVLAIAGLIVSIIGMTRPKRGLAIGGLVTSIVAIVASVISLVMMLSSTPDRSASSAASASLAEVSSSSVPAPSVEKEPEPEPSSVEEEPEPEPEFYNVGESADSGDVKITFVGLTQSAGSEYNRPEDGNVFLLCEFNIDNDSKQDINISSIVSFEAYVDDYTVTQSLTGLFESGNKGQLDGSVAAGKKMNGVIAYEVPADWAELEIRVDPAVLSWSASREVVFKAFNG